MFGDSVCFKLLTHHETCNVLQEDKRDFPLATKFDEMGPFNGTFTEEHTVVGNDADGVAVDVSEASNQSGAEKLLELVETTSIKNTAQDCVHVELAFRVHWDDAVEILGWEQWTFWLLPVFCVLIVVVVCV